MKAIIHNLQDSSIKPYEENMAFKAAYLFATMLVASGDSSSIAFFKHGYPEDAPLKRQLMLLEINAFPDPAWRELAASIPGWRKQLKKWNDIKHPTKDMLVARKKLLDAIKSNYLLVRNHILDHFPGRAFLLLGDLLTEENYAHIDSDRENRELQDDFYNSLSGVMKITIDKEDLEQGLLLLLTDNFFISEAAKGIKVQENLEGIEEMNPHLVSLFSFPDLNQYKKEELQSLRQGIAAQLTPFNEAVNNWIEGFAQEEKNGTEQKQRTEQVYTRAKEVEGALKAHVLVQQMATKNREVELVLAAMPAATVWQYLREVGAVPDETWEVLSNDADGKKLCPVMALRYVDRGHFYMDEENEELLIPAEKKSLLID
jgi:hypothetical protein